MNRPRLADVLRETATGATPQTVAARLGLDPGLVEAMVDHAQRVGLVWTPTCTSCTASLPTCAGCPLSRG
ncbi:MAG: hypothetical protein FWE61_01365 [Micrococcales bacterium]|nr:hypothetical protein [Micrococcales bacterium]